MSETDVSKDRVRSSIAIAASRICALMVIASAFHVLTSEDDRTIFSLKLSEDGSFYYINIDGNDRFDEYLEHGSTDNQSFNRYLMDNVTCGKSLSRFTEANCSTFVTENASGPGHLVGRNFDYYDAMPCAVFCSGEGIYSSVSTTDLGMFCDLGESFDDIVRDTRVNAVSYIPMDGINEKGVFICINAVHNGDPVEQHEEGRTDIFITSALRVVLNYADSALKAVELIQNYNVHGTSDFHMFVTDDNGIGYTVEYIDGVSYVSETQLLTNHYITPAGSDVPVTESSGLRYAKVKAAMDHDPEMDKTQVRDVLISVKQDNPDHIHFTRWSVVYDLNALDVLIFIRIGEVIDYDHGYSYSLTGPWGR